MKNSLDSLSSRKNNSKLCTCNIWFIVFGDSWHVGLASKPSLKLKYHSISLVHKINFGWQIALKLCTGNDSETAVLCAKYRNDLTSKKWVAWKRVFARFYIKMSFVRISYIKIPPFFKSHGYICIYCSELILGLRPANERRRYLVTTSIIG